MVELLVIFYFFLHICFIVGIVVVIVVVVVVVVFPIPIFIILPNISFKCLDFWTTQKKKKKVFFFQNLALFFFLYRFYLNICMCAIFFFNRFNLVEKKKKDWCENWVLFEIKLIQMCWALCVCVCYWLSECIGVCVCVCVCAQCSVSFFRTLFFCYLFPYPKNPFPIPFHSIPYPPPHYPNSFTNTLFVHNDISIV